jgi:hypothetical protein
LISKNKFLKNKFFGALKFGFLKTKKVLIIFGIFAFPNICENLLELGGQHVYTTHKRAAEEEENERNPDLKILFLCVHNSTHSHTLTQTTNRARASCVCV